MFFSIGPTFRNHWEAEAYDIDTFACGQMIVGSKMNVNDHDYIQCFTCKTVIISIISLHFVPSHISPVESALVVQFSWGYISYSVSLNFNPLKLKVYPPE